MLQRKENIVIRIEILERRTIWETRHFVDLASSRVSLSSGSASSNTVCIRLSWGALSYFLENLPILFLERTGISSVFSRL